MTSYTLVPIKSRPGAVFAIDTSDYDEYVTNMPNWYPSGSNGKYLSCDWKRPDGKVRPRINRLLLLGLDTDKTKVVDHINGDTLDNRRCNLRVISKSANVAHRANENKNNSSGVRGLHWCKTNKRWIVSIQHNEDTWWKKSFEDKDEAIKELNEKREEYEVEIGIKVSHVPERIPELIKSNEILDNWNKEHPGKISNKASKESREKYNERRRQVTAEKREKLKQELLNQEQTYDVITKLRRLEGDARRANSKHTGEKLSLEEKRQVINEGRRLKTTHTSQTPTGQ